MPVISLMLLQKQEVGLEGGANNYYGIIIVTLLCSEIMGGYNTPDTLVEIGA